MPIFLTGAESGLCDTKATVSTSGPVVHDAKAVVATLAVLLFDTRAAVATLAVGLCDTRAAVSNILAKLFDTRVLVNPATSFLHQMGNVYFPWPPSRPAARGVRRHTC